MSLIHYHLLFSSTKCTHAYARKVPHHLYARQDQLLAAPYEPNSNTIMNRKGRNRNAAFIIPSVTYNTASKYQTRVPVGSLHSVSDKISFMI
jgi:hypothetical protein